MNIRRILLIFTRNSFFLFALLLALSASIPSSSNAASQQALNDPSSNPSLEYAADSILVKFSADASPAKKMNARALVSGKKIGVTA